MTCIVIPDSVTTIGNCAFSKCTSLISITIPDSVTTVGRSALNGCHRLTKIIISHSVTTIEDYTFFNCCALKSLTIPPTVTFIGKGAFSKCRLLKIITIPDNVTDIGFCAFQYCCALNIITLPEGIDTIGKCAFKGCCSLTTLLVKPTVVNDDDDDVKVSRVWKKLFEQPDEGDDFYDEYANIDGKEQVAPLAEVTRVWAPDHVIKQLTGQYKDYATFAEVPRAMRAAPDAKSWASVQLCLRWSDPETDAAEKRVLKNSRKLMVWTVMYVAVRLEILPDELWLLIFTFVKHE
jgi:hypothetical protein